MEGNIIDAVSFIAATKGVLSPVIVKNIIPRIKNVPYDNKIEVLDMYVSLTDKP